MLGLRFLGLSGSVISMNTITENLSITQTILPAVRMNPRNVSSPMVEYVVVRSTHFCVAVLADKVDAAVADILVGEKSLELLFGSGMFGSGDMVFVGVPTKNDMKIQARVKSVFSDGVICSEYRLMVSDKVSGGYPNHKLFMNMSISPFVFHANNFSKKNPFWGKVSSEVDYLGQLDSFEKVAIWADLMKRSGNELFKSYGIESDFNIAYMLVANQVWKNLNMARQWFEVNDHNRLLFRFEKTRKPVVPFNVLMPGFKKLSLFLLTRGVNFLQIDNFFQFLFRENLRRAASLPAVTHKKWLESWAFGEKNEEAAVCATVPREVQLELLANS